MKKFYLTVMVLALLFPACATAPATQTALVNAATYAAEKAACESSGKVFICAAGIADCKCVDRPTPPSPPAPPAVSVTPPTPEPVQPPPAPTPVPPPPTVATKTYGPYGQNEWYSMDVSGKTDWSHGKITFSVKGLSFDQLPRGKDGFLFMAKLKTPNGQEGNFQYNIADILPRLISQRFDGTCPRHCEEQWSDGVNWSGEETYSFVFEWTQSTVTCVVKDSAGTVMFDGKVNTFGPYVGADWIRIGNGIYPPYPAVSSAITVINPTLE